ncbi:Transposase IS66 family protein [Legionella massiliensis]|uniref:Transposase IS66 family protein n=1 Tax=Legionella massiliensis TaxID=1034943 RepID=A0A078KX47_9GAMM|nr:IS6 family transposase [Legionella massiliensis]CDZ76344.1 Transposase IS66 family protein [Legionella massiliensis]CEE12082.1 Transposase IS66 family protein [Legionella massiliensis]
MLKYKPQRYRYPVEIISTAVWSYHRFNDSYRDVSERLLYRGIEVSYETVRQWCIKFGSQFKDVIKKREPKPSDKWHLDEQQLRINGEVYYLWRAVDEEGFELDVFLQKRRNKKAAIRFLSRLLNAYPKPQVIVTDKLRSYTKPISQMSKGTEHRSHKGLNNRAENAHQPTRRKEKCLIRFKSPASAQQVLAIMGKTRNLFAVAVGRYTNSASQQRIQFLKAKEIWQNTATEILYA